MNAELIIRSMLLGVGLAMDAFSVSLANGLNKRNFGTAWALYVAAAFALFQFAMPMTGWFLVRKAAETFTSVQPFIPWIALILLLYIGCKMLLEGLRERGSEAAAAEMLTDGAYEGEPGYAGSKDAAGAKAGRGNLSASDLFIQGVATSIDALSVGFTMAAYSTLMAAASSLIIGLVTLIICIAGLYIGRQIGTRLSGRASILGGIILIAIGIEIWVSGVFF